MEMDRKLRIVEPREEKEPPTVVSVVRRPDSIHDVYAEGPSGPEKVCGVTVLFCGAREVVADRVGRADDEAVDVLGAVVRNARPQEIIPPGSVPARVTGVGPYGLEQVALLEVVPCGFDAHIKD